MANSFFQFKQFTVQQDRCAMKVTTDSCLFGAWVVEQINVDHVDTATILDIGAGTGLLSLMLAQKTDGMIDGIEIDNEAFEQANENVESSPWRDKIRLRRGNVSEFMSDTKYKVIVSNPPFYENELRSPDKKRSLAHHEGIELEQLLKVIREYLDENGTFFLLLPFKRLQEIYRLIERSQFSVVKKVLVRQSAAHEPIRIMIEGSHHRASMSTFNGEMVIRDVSGNYTREFEGLLKDYYLKL